MTLTEALLSLLETPWLAKTLECAPSIEFLSISRDLVHGHLAARLRQADDESR